MAANEEPQDVQAKKRRLQKYRKEWEREFSWVEYVRGNDYKANCTVCRRVFTIGHGGVCDLKQHASGVTHKRNERARRTQADRALSKFIVHQTSPEADLVRIIIVPSNDRK